MTFFYATYLAPSPLNRSWVVAKTPLRFTRKKAAAAAVGETLELTKLIQEASLKAVLRVNFGGGAFQAAPEIQDVSFWPKSYRLFSSSENAPGCDRLGLFISYLKLSD